MAAASLGHQRRASTSSTMATSGAPRPIGRRRTAGRAAARCPSSRSSRPRTMPQPTVGVAVGSSAGRRAAGGDRRALRRSAAGSEMAPEATHAGQRREPRRQLIVELLDARGVGVGLSREVGLEAEAVLRLRSRGRVCSSPCRLRSVRPAQMTGKRGGEADLDDRQRVAQPRRPSACPRRDRRGARPRTPRRFAATSAGASPTISVTTTRIAPVKSAAGRLKPISSSRGTSAGANATSAEMAVVRHEQAAERPRSRPGPRLR